MCRLFSLLEHERGCISFPSRNDGVFAHAAICVYIYICICCKVSFICTGLFKSALALFFSLARISLTHTRVHTHTQSSDSQLMNTVLPQQLWETHSSSLYLGDGWRGGQKKLWRDASEGSLLGSDNDSPHTYFYFILFIR